MSFEIVKIDDQSFEFSFWSFSDSFLFLNPEHRKSSKCSFLLLNFLFCQINKIIVNWNNLEEKCYFYVKQFECRVLN